MYVQSNRSTILSYNRVYSRINALYNVSDLTGPSSGAYQAVCAGLVNGDSRTVSCVWPLRCCRKNWSRCGVANATPHLDQLYILNSIFMACLLKVDVSREGWLQLNIYIYRCLETGNCKLSWPVTFSGKELLDSETEDLFQSTG
jgi:hypothetical protein